MFKSFLCRLFGCGCGTTLFSAKIDSNQGFDNPTPIADLDGWTVWKQQQTEIYVIRHNLGLTNPGRQMHIVATPMDANTILVIESVERDQFTVSTWLPGPTSTDSAFMFIAVQRP